MKRSFSVIRRRPHIVDVLFPLTAGVQTYRLKWASNFDGSFTQFLDSTNVGFLDPSINPAVVGSQPTAGRQVRVVFDPDTYSIPDAEPFWLQYWTVPFGGAEEQQSAAALILPDSSNHGVGIVTIHGTAPSAMDVSGSLQIDLPRMMQDIRIHNEDGTNSLFVATEEGGAETKLGPGPVPQFANVFGTHASLWVRGGGATVDFSASFTAAFPK